VDEIKDGEKESAVWGKDNIMGLQKANH